MNLKLSYKAPSKEVLDIQVTGSKSESNRLLILQALYQNIQIENVSHSDDSRLLTKALSNTSNTIDIHHAGTAMRFLTAYFSLQNGKVVTLTGSKRMQERPMGVLVDALRKLGATIDYIQKEGYPPLLIRGTTLSAHSVSIKAEISSQYISALMLIAPSLEKGLTIQLEGKVTSVPYIKMTLSLLKQIGIEGTFSENTIIIPPVKTVPNKVITVESDWSSASYFYSIVAMAPNATIRLKSYKETSLQGDSALSKIYQSLGVTTEFNATDHSITLSKNNTTLEEELHLDLSNTPDIAQTIAVTCFGLGKRCHLTGLHTLKIKETDRLEALKTELRKLGASITVTQDSLTLSTSEGIRNQVSIATYHDHRMAMAFAPLAIKTSLIILESEVVSKSFPSFWQDLEKVGILSKEFVKRR